MPTETLLSAARRAQRSFNIDMQHGGVITQDTELAFDLLQRELDRATRIIKEQGQLLITYRDTYDEPFPPKAG